MPASAPAKKNEAKGLRFVSGARMRSATYVVRPAIYERDPLTGMRIGVRPALRATFKEHQFNSRSAQQANNWTDEERILVEKYLLNHPDFGRADGRGLFIDKSTTVPQAIPDYLLDETEEAPAAATVPLYTGARCEWLGEEGDQTVQCSEPATDESGFCARHAAMIEAAGIGE